MQNPLWSPGNLPEGPENTYEPSSSLYPKKEEILLAIGGLCFSGELIELVKKLIISKLQYGYIEYGGQWEKIKYDLPAIPKYACMTQDQVADYYLGRILKKIRTPVEQEIADKEWDEVGETKPTDTAQEFKYAEVVCEL